MTVPALDVLRATVGMWRYKRDAEWDRRVEEAAAALADLEALVEAAESVLDWEMNPITGEIPPTAQPLAAALARVLGETP